MIRKKRCSPSRQMMVIQATLLVRLSHCGLTSLIISSRRSLSIKTQWIARNFGSTLPSGKEVVEQVLQIVRWQWLKWLCGILRVVCLIFLFGNCWVGIERRFRLMVRPCVAMKWQVVSLLQPIMGILPNGWLTEGTRPLSFIHGCRQFHGHQV